jgi:hypothetical protein
MDAREPHPVPRSERAGTYCEDYEENGCRVDVCPSGCWQARPSHAKQMSDFELRIGRDDDGPIMELKLWTGTRESYRSSVRAIQKWANDQIKEMAHGPSLDELT